MADIFVSYAAEDRERVRPLVTALESQGYSVWWDGRIGIGNSFDRVIEYELDLASCVVVMWSEHSVESDWVRNEAEEGKERGILVPVRIDDVRLPLAFRRSQAASLLNWPDEPDEFDKLLLAVRNCVENSGESLRPPASDTATRQETQETSSASTRRVAVMNFRDPSPDQSMKWFATGRQGLMWLMGGAVGISTLLLLFVTRSVWLPPTERFPVPPDQWIQLTNFPDFANQPALSRDGRMLTFIRGPGSFVTSGQIYSKVLPDGTPIQLTQDDYQKMSPVFSPDGSRIAYTTVRGKFEWNTWQVEPGAEPGLWLSNASGLVWTDEENLLFSERIVGEGIHMKVVAARENKANARDMYIPEQIAGMVHRSYSSPDGEWAIIAQMDKTTSFLPCELVPLRGTVPPRQVGPLEGSCTFAEWSPDGEWMYFTSSAGGENHIWRQMFPDGDLQQVTSGTDQEEGIAISPDGNSLITAVVKRQSSVWISEGGDERQISLEGYAFDPTFTPDGQYLLYRILLGPAPVSDPTELWRADLQSGRTELLLPGFSLFGFHAYDVSDDGDQIVIAAPNAEGRPRIWLAPLDRSGPPEPVPNAEGDQPHFGPDGEVFFRAVDGRTQYPYRINQDGTGLRRAIERPIDHLSGLSPDGEWLVAWAELPGDDGVKTYAFPLQGGNPTLLYDGGGTNHSIDWSSDGRTLFLPGESGQWLGSGGFGETVLIPIPPGQSFPDAIAEGLVGEGSVAAIRGATVIDSGDVRPGPSPEVYAFSRQSVQSNLYRIPLP